MDNKPAEAQQEARTKLRQSFLMAIKELNGHPCHILTYEKTTLDAEFAGWKPDGSEVIVRDLKTPFQTYIQSALLRSSDILSIQFKNPIPLP